MMRRMNVSMRRLASSLTIVAVLAGAAHAQGTGRPPVPADPWPREVKLADATLLLYQPQVNSWAGNILDFRAAVAVTPTGSKQETFGVVWGTARTHVDRVSRIVTLEDLKLSRSNFPTLPDHGAAYLAALPARLGRAQRTIALDRLQASLAASGTVKPAGHPGQRHPAADHRQRVARDPGPDRRSAGHASRPGHELRAHHQYPGRSSPASRGPPLTISMSTTAGSPRARSRARGPVRGAPLPPSIRSPTPWRPRGRWTCSMGRGHSRSPRSPRACPRST